MSCSRTWHGLGWVGVIGALVFAGGCAPGGGAKATTAAKPAAAAATPAAPPAPPAPAPEPVVEHVIEEEYDALVVGAAEGLLRVEPDGKGSQTISPGAALAPRWLSLGSVVVLRPELGSDLTQGVRVERVSLRDGQRTQLAVLPPLACTGATASARLELLDPRDFRIVHEDHLACLKLTERTTNRTLTLEIDLRHGRVQRERGAEPATCKPPLPLRATTTPSVCQADSAGDERLVANVNSYPFTFEREQLLDTTHANKSVLTLRGYAEEALSPSDRWQVLGGNAGETGARRLLLLDRQEGALFALSDKPGPWPEALARPGQAARALGSSLEAAAPLPRAIEPRWLGDAEHELLVLGGLVVPPGHASFALPGELAR